jgi:hypothetical protein
VVVAQVVMWSSLPEVLLMANGVVKINRIRRIRGLKVSMGGTDIAQVTHER